MPQQTPESLVAELAHQYGSRLRRFLFLRTRNKADVPDLAQEVFLRLMRVQNNEIIRSPEAYLFTIARHVAHQHMLHETSLPATLDIIDVLQELQSSAADDPFERAVIARRGESLKRALDQLPPRLSETLILHRFAGYTIEEIATQLGVARITAAKYLAQALLHCRQVVNDRE